MYPPRSKVARLARASIRRLDFVLVAAVLLGPLLGATARGQQPQPRRTLSGHQFEVYSVAFSPDGTTLASGAAYLSADLKPGEIFLWDVKTGKRRGSLEGHKGGIWSLAFAPDGKTLASASADRTIKLWETATGKVRATLEGHGDWVRSVAFAPDGKTLASASNDLSVRLWDAATGKGRAILRGHTQPVTCVAFAPGGKVLASNGFDNTIRVWDVPAGKQQASLPTKNISYQMAFSPDGKTLALGGGEGVQLWDTGSWRVRATLKSRASNVYSVAFAPDGKTLASASASEGVVLWNLTDRREVAVLPHALPPRRRLPGRPLPNRREVAVRPQGNVVLSVAFAPDGKLVASGNGATPPFEVKLWDVPPASGRAPGRE